MKAILSLLFLAILILCTWSGYKKGLIMGIGSLVAFIIAIYGASLLSDTYSGEIVDAMRPFASGYMEVQVVDEKVRPALGMDDTQLSVTDYLAQNPGKQTEFCTMIYDGMGIYEPTGEQLAAEATEYAATHENVSLQDAVVEVLCQRIAYAAGFVIAFIMILIILIAIGNIPNISFKIPNFDFLNDISGAVFGLIHGICLCLVIGWTLKFTGLLIPQETLADTFLVPWFMDRTILVHFLGI